MKFEREKVFMWATAVLWIPAMLVGIVCGILTIGFIAGLQWVTADRKKK
jgi:hypothetical protein